ncbi:hypothetical protein DB347_03655 [Opitutaceae bacterium EW11]|nr:hypothetical protein DB347_03655 [Opitutaceae bacterium EW11]
MMQKPSSLALSVSNLRNSRAGYYAVGSRPRAGRIPRVDTQAMAERLQPASPQLSQTDRLIRRDWLDRLPPTVTRYHE